MNKVILNKIDLMLDDQDHTDYQMMARVVIRDVVINVVQIEIVGAEKHSAPAQWI